MNAAWISLGALLSVIVISSFSGINVGILAMGLAWILGHSLAGMSGNQVAAGFPVQLFVLLLGVTLLFTEIKLNGTLDKLAVIAVKLVRGRKALLPVVFFLLTAFFSALGPGNIAATALLAPLAMQTAERMKIGAFLMTIMVVSGANAGAFSPISPTGLIANGLAAHAGLNMHPWREIFLPSFFAQGFIALFSYFLLGGIRLWRMHGNESDTLSAAAETPWTRTQWISLAAVGALVMGVTFFEAHTGFFAIGLAAILALLHAANPEKSLAHVPWNAILMVCGVSTLVSVLEATGGMELFTDILAKASNASNVTGVIALVTGMVSAFSSSSGVVLPAFIPAVPRLIAKLGGGDSAAIISSINVGSHVVDVSPLSTLGALCLASASEHEDRRRLFRNLMIYGLSLSVFGAAVCYLFFG